MSKSKIFIVCTTIILLLLFLFISSQYKTKTGQELAKHAAEFKRCTDISIQLNIYEDEAYSLLEEYKIKKPTQAEEEHITSRCTEITEYVNSNFNVSFEDIGLYDEPTDIIEVIDAVKYVAISNANSTLNKCLDIIKKSDYRQVQKNHRFQGCITIINECFSNYDKNTMYISTDDREEYLKMKAKFEEAIKELEN